mmetsp:Transcript_40631/g.85334  ORF Transcript_40631/g.85334 Transcript_40631/m.85334 type:complete len:138 (-) Transcript_40631:128-541(-)
MGSCFSKAGLIVPPEVTVTKIANIKLRGAIHSDVTLTISNPNPVEINAKSFTYCVCKKSDGTLIAEGTGKPFAALCNQNTEVVTPVKFTYGGIGAAGKSLLFRGKTEILFEGTLVFDAPWTRKGEVSVPFSGELCIE